MGDTGGAHDSTSNDRDAHLAELGGALRAGGSRRTAPRLHILRALAENRGHLSATEIHRHIQAAGERTNLATVYRSVDRLTALGLAHSVSGAEVRYGLGRDGHAHATCTGCGTVADIAEAPTAGAAVALAQASGFTAGPLVMSGLCPVCRARGQ